jgi:hypothetical protein
MNRTASLVLTAIIFFLAGLLTDAGVQWYLRTYFAKTTIVQGVLKLQTQQIEDLGTSGNPPNGYFVESSAIDRFYVEGDLMKPYVGSLVSLQGEALSTICGPDAFPCYPKMRVKAVTKIPGQP